MLKNKFIISLSLSLLISFPALAGNTFSNKKKNNYKLLINENESYIEKSRKNIRHNKIEEYVVSENELMIINENISYIKVIQSNALQALNLIAEQRDLHPWEELDDENAASYAYSYAYASIAFEKVNYQLELAKKSIKLKNGIEVSKNAKEKALYYADQVLKYASYL